MAMHQDPIPIDPGPGDAAAAGRGSAAPDELLPLVYKELRARAARLLANQRPDHTLQRTALVHEAYLKLVKSGVQFQSPLHFFNVAANAMRQILVDHAISGRRHKRGGGRQKLNLDDVTIAPTPESKMDWLALNESLDRLREFAPRQSQVVMLRFFAGLGDAEIAELLGISAPTVRRDWAAARTWLYQQMKDPVA
jgi:RNA polymerase sigma factor (TIGR02999 family)